MDDTNPTKEDVEFVDAIKEDIHWLGFDWGDRFYYGSDYFEKDYEYAVELIKKGTKAPQAAGKIHTDFERGFIRAEVIAFEDLKTLGTMANAKAQGRVRSEGKEYVMKDGDIVNFLFNV